MSIVKVYKTFVFLLILAILGIIAWGMASLIELTIMMSFFLVTKQKYEFKYHCKSSIQCFLLSVGVFFAAMRISLPVHLSYTFSGMVGILIAYAAQYVAKLKFIREDYEYIEPRYNRFVENQRLTSIYTMDECSLREYCKANLLDEIDEEIVVQRLIYRRKGKDLYDKIGYSKPQMIRREKRIEEKLNIKLKQT